MIVFFHQRGAAFGTECFLAKQEDAGGARREPCMYAERCYRKNPAHRAEYSHPGDDDYGQQGRDPESEARSDKRPECQYGTACYRTNPRHRREFGHTRAPQSDAQSAAAARPPGVYPAALFTTSQALFIKCL